MNWRIIVMMFVAGAAGYGTIELVFAAAGVSAASAVLGIVLCMFVGFTIGQVMTPWVMRR